MTPPGHSPEDIAYKWKALTPTAMGMFMATMDASITNITFPVLIEALRTDLNTVVWVTLAFTLVGTSSMLVLGKIGDRAGRKTIYSIGMCIFTAGMGACAVAQTIGQLIFFRAVQAIGAAMTISTSTAIVTEAFPPKETGRGIGMFNPSNNSIVMSSVTRDRLGMASALIATLRQVGLSLGTAIAGATFSARLAVRKRQLSFQGLTGKDLDRFSIPPAFHDVLLISVVLGVVVIGLSAWTWMKHRGSQMPS